MGEGMNDPIATGDKRLYSKRCELCGDYFPAEATTRSKCPDFCGRCIQAAKVGDEMQASVERVIKGGQLWQK